MTLNLWEFVDSLIHSGKLIDAIEYLKTELKNCVSPHFKSLIGASFTNSPRDIAAEISRFIQACENKFPIKAVYLEMNGFDINPDRWYFDCFGYRTYPENLEDPDWLADWDSEEWSGITLSGLERVQQEFAWLGTHIKDRETSAAAEYAILLVLCRFISLIESAVDTGLLRKGLPIFATAHDFDIVARFMT